MGTGNHVLLVRKDVRTAIGKKVGDSVKVNRRALFMLNNKMIAATSPQ
jgi:hypothetical protein